MRRLKRQYSGAFTHLSTQRRNARASALGARLLAFRILISTILSHRTRDANTARATDALFSRYPSMEQLARAPIGSIETLISPVGFYRIKARYVKECSKQVLTRFSGRVPMDRGKLMTLPGVGAKTSACVLNYAFEQDVVAVDVHVHRVSNRLGLVKTKTPEQTEEQLTAIAPLSLQRSINELFVLHGQRTCSPITPSCSRCPLAGVCAYAKAGGRHR